MNSKNWINILKKKKTIQDPSHASLRFVSYEEMFWSKQIIIIPQHLSAFTNDMMNGIDPLITAVTRTRDQYFQ